VAPAGFEPAASRLGRERPSDRASGPEPTAGLEPAISRIPAGRSAISAWLATNVDPRGLAPRSPLCESGALLLELQAQKCPRPDSNRQPPPSESGAHSPELRGLAVEGVPHADVVMVTSFRAIGGTRTLTSGRTQALNLPRMPFRHDRVSAPGFEPGTKRGLSSPRMPVPPSARVLAPGIEPDPSAYRAAARTSEPRQAPRSRRESNPSHPVDSRAASQRLTGAYARRESHPRLRDVGPLLSC
jgi:hypothetical protein